MRKPHPSVLFAKDGEIYDLEGLRHIVIAAPTVWTSSIAFTEDTVGGQMNNQVKKSSNM